MRQFRRDRTNRYQVTISLSVTDNLIITVNIDIFNLTLPESYLFVLSKLSLLYCYFVIALSFFRCSRIYYCTRLFNYCLLICYCYYLVFVIIFVYQTMHRFNGFNWLPFGQLYALLNSGKFDNTPMTRNTSGLCSSISTCCSAAASFLWPHQNLNKIK